MKRKLATAFMAVLLAATAAFVFTACFDGGEHDLEEYIEVDNRFYAIHAAQTPENPLWQHITPTPRIRVPVNPQYVAVFDHAILDVMLALGLQDRVVGIAHFATVPDYILEAFPQTGANALADISDSRPHDPDYELLERLRHEGRLDLIIMGGRQRSVPADANFSRLSYLAPTIDLGLATGGDDFVNHFIENVEIIAEIFNAEIRAEMLLGFVTSRIEATNALANRLNANALIVQLNGGNMAVHGGAGRYSLIHRELGLREAIANIPGTNQGAGVTEDPHGSQIGPEAIVAANPHIIFVIDRGAAIGEDASSVDIIRNHPLFGEVSAVANGNVVELDSGSWYFVAGGLFSMQVQINEIYSALRALEA